MEIQHDLSIIETCVIIGLFLFEIIGIVIVIQLQGINEKLKKEIKK